MGQWRGDVGMPGLDWRIGSMGGRGGRGGLGGI